MLSARRAASDERLRGLGIEAERIGRWDRGVDVDRFSPALRDAARPTGASRVLYAGRLTREKGVDLLADAFLAARARDPRLHLVLAGGGPEEDALRARLGEPRRFLGWLEGDALARAYASADLFLFCSPDRHLRAGGARGAGLRAAGRRGGGGRPVLIVEDGGTGRLCPPDAQALADAVAGLAAAPLQRERLAQRRARRGPRAHLGARALGRLAEGYRRALGERQAAGTRRAA